jgi:hypothetical protein
MKTERRKREVQERLEDKLGPKDPVTGCIEWTAGRNKAGYGRINRGRRGEGTVLAHRLVWELKHGPIPPGMEVCHSCDNPPCCNEAHLFLGTHQDNVADMVAKDRGKHPKGEVHGRAKLTEADVVEIRRRLAAGESQRKIAASFGITQGPVCCIKTGRTWKHLK